MQCPYRNLSRESGCELVDDLYGIAGAVARQFCDYRDCQECPLFQEALQECLREWSKQQTDQEYDRQLAENPTLTSASPVAGFWKLVLEQKHHDHAA